MKDKPRYETRDEICLFDFLFAGLLRVVLQAVVGYLREEEKTGMRNGTSFLACGNVCFDELME